MTDPAAREDSIVIEFDHGTSASRERVIFEPALGDGWNRLEQSWDGCQWRTRGVERVYDVDVETPAVDDLPAEAPR